VSRVRIPTPAIIGHLNDLFWPNSKDLLRSVFGSGFRNRSSEIRIAIHVVNTCISSQHPHSSPLWPVCMKKLCSKACPNLSSRPNLFFKNCSRMVLLPSIPARGRHIGLPIGKKCPWANRGPGSTPFLRRNRGENSCNRQDVMQSISFPRIYLGPYTCQQGSIQVPWAYCRCWIRVSTPEGLSWRRFDPRRGQSFSFFFRILSACSLVEILDFFMFMRTPEANTLSSWR
jgi:hypothetical protein